MSMGGALPWFAARVGRAGACYGCVACNAPFFHAGLCALHEHWRVQAGACALSTKGGDAGSRPGARMSRRMYYGRNGMHVSCAEERAPPAPGRVCSSRLSDRWPALPCAPRCRRRYRWLALCGHMHLGGMRPHHGIYNRAAHFPPASCGMSGLVEGGQVPQEAGFI